MSAATKWPHRTPEGHIRMPVHIAEFLGSMRYESPEREICGLILAPGGDQRREWAVVPVTNVAKGGKEFVMDNDELIRIFSDSFDDVIGVYHSHPSDRPEPSDEDLVFAQPQWRYFIVTSAGTYEWDIKRHNDKDGTMFEIVLLGAV